MTHLFAQAAQAAPSDPTTIMGIIAALAFSLVAMASVIKDAMKNRKKNGGPAPASAADLEALSGDVAEVKAKQEKHSEALGEINTTLATISADMRWLKDGAAEGGE